jgi:tRNA(Ile)-lysidine synthase
MPAGRRLVDELLPRCTFPPAGSAVSCAFSGGADSSALLVLAVAAGCHPTAIHVDHGLRPTSGAEADQAERIATRLDVPFERRTVDVVAGPNLEARARNARAAVLPPDVLTGHTADDQAETVLINLLRGAGATGLAAMEPGPTKPLLAIRHTETVALCAGAGLDPIVDPSNTDRRFLRNRIRHDVLPLLSDVAGRDVVSLLVRTAAVLRDDDRLLDSLAGVLDPTDARAIVAAEPALARRALRRWIGAGGYPPDVATLERALAVAHGRTKACELGGGRRLERRRQRLQIVVPSPEQRRVQGSNLVERYEQSGG